MMESAASMRAAVAEYSPAAAPDMQQNEIVTLDLEGCNFVYFNLVFESRDLEGQGVSHRFETWPDGIQQWMNKEIADWLALHPNASVKGITTGVRGDTAVLGLHWRAKA